MGVRDPISPAPGAASDKVERLGGTATAGGWIDVLSKVFDCTPFRAAATGPPDGSFTVFHFGFFLVCHAMGVTGRLLRGPARLGLDGFDHIVVTICVRGRIGFSDGAAHRLRPGDVIVSDLGGEFACTLLASDSIHLVIPRLLLPPAVAPPDIFAPRRLSSERLATGFLCELAEMLIRIPSYAEKGQALALASILRVPLAFCIGTSDGGPFPPDQRTRSRQLRRHIEDNIGDPNLTPASIANRFGMSRSQLFRQFEDAGGVETFIRKRRMRRALVSLADPDLSGRRIGDIAYDAGFNDEAHFSKLFRATYGTAPRAFRQAARQGRLTFAADGSSAAQSPADRLQVWLRQLRDA